MVRVKLTTPTLLKLPRTVSIQFLSRSSLDVVIFHMISLLSTSVLEKAIYSASSTSHIDRFCNDSSVDSNCKDIDVVSTQIAPCFLHLVQTMSACHLPKFVTVDVY